MSIPAPSHLDPSELGTKEYWDAAYATELSNHAADASDTGHVWFAESDAEGRVAAYLARLADDAVLSAADTAFLDLGSGNGSMLRALRADGWTADMLGVDYSEASVALARRSAAADAGAEDEARADDAGDVGEDGGEGDVAQDGDGEEAEEEEEEERAPALRFEAWDLIKGEYEPWIWARPAGGSPSSAAASDAPDAKSGCRPWDVVLDKGTFDAISLSGERDEQGRRIVETYRERIKPLVARGKGMLLITSCNWTEEELERWFVRPDETGDEDGGFVLRGRVKYPTFRFGGKEGQAISSVCFGRT